MAPEATAASPRELVLPAALARTRSDLARLPRISIVAPALNEEANLVPLKRRLEGALGDTDWELVLVDDGSRDRTARVIRRLARADRRVVGVVLARNHGQTAATAAGIAIARGELIATIDADLQNDPADLPGMIDALGEHAAVVGYRTRRRDNLVRRLSSRIANSVRNGMSGDSIRDTGCSLKVFRAEALRALPLFEGMHRFLPTLLRIHGFSVIEHPVSHHPRVTGESKYGIGNRALRAFRDLLAVRWMRSRVIRLAVAQVVAFHPAGMDDTFEAETTCSNNYSLSRVGPASAPSSRGFSSNGSPRNGLDVR